MKKSKKLFSLILSMVLTFTAVFGVIPLQSLAAPKSDNDLIMNFDFGYGSGSGSSYSCKDYFSNTYMSSYLWGTSAEATTLDDEPVFYNQNGYLYANTGSSNLYGNTAYRLEFKVRTNSSDRTEAAILAMGTANGSYGIADADT